MPALFMKCLSWGQKKRRPRLTGLMFSLIKRDEEEENKDDGKKSNGRNKGKHVVVKFGPPQGKQNKNPSSAQQTTNPAVVGPSSALVNAKRPSDWSKKTNPKKRELEHDLTTDIPAKYLKTNNGSKKVVRRLDDDCLETVMKSSKQSKSSKLSEPSILSKLEEKKRKQSDQQELAESS